MKLKYLFLIVFTLFITGLAKAQEPAKSADLILKDAYAKAAKEKKKVFLIFHASWCGWCHKMDEAMNDASCKQLFNDNYIICHLVVLESEKNKNLENPGAMELLKKYHGDKQGIPFWLVLNKDGKLLADSQIRPAGASLDTMGENIGCPAKKEEVAAFLKVLKSTSSLSDVQLAVIGKRFESINGGH
jgi:thiol-disulfide isomerase/thioredoxin